MGTLLDELTQNPMRSQAILSIVREAMDEGDTSLAAVSLKTSRFGESFGDIGEDELAAALGLLSEGDDAAPANVEPVAESSAPTMTRDEAAAELKARQEALHAARQARAMAEADQRRARGAVADAITEWTQGGPSADVIRRNEIAAISADRKSKVAQGPQRQPGPSYLDRSRFYSAEGDANDYARGRMTNGGSRRGAFPASARGRKIAVPSER